MFTGLLRSRRARHAKADYRERCAHTDPPLCPTCGRPLDHLGRDWLTGLLDRGAWHHHADLVLADGAARREPVTLLIADLDRFKIINDEHGHLAGDDALRQVAGILRAVTRHTDLVARYGGDEFLVLMPDTDADDAREVARRLNLELNAARLPTLSARQGEIILTGLSASVGLATYRTGTGLEDLLLAADAALLAAKRNGRAQSCIRGGRDWTFDRAVRPFARRAG